MVDTDDTRRMTNDGRRTTPRVWHKLLTGELKNGIQVRSGEIMFGLVNHECLPDRMSGEKLNTFANSEKLP